MSTEYTLREELEAYSKKGYTADIVVKNEQEAQVEGRELNPSDLKIDEHQRFEGKTNPSDMSIIYAVSEKGKKLGVIVDSFNPKEETKESLFVKRLDQ